MLRSVFSLGAGAAAPLGGAAALTALSSLSLSVARAAGKQAVPWRLAEQAVRRLCAGWVPAG